MSERQAPRSAYDSFLRKVELIEEWAAQGVVPAGETLPVGPVQLARWESPERGLTAWKSPNVAAPAPSGKYPNLRARFDAAVATLHVRSTRDHSTQLAELKRTVQSLAEQVCVLAHEKQLLEDALARETSLKEVAQTRCAELATELRSIVPLR